MKRHQGLLNLLIGSSLILLESLQLSKSREMGHLLLEIVEIYASMTAGILWQIMKWRLYGELLRPEKCEFLGVTLLSCRIRAGLLGFDSRILASSMSVHYLAVGIQRQLCPDIGSCLFQPVRRLAVTKVASVNKIQLRLMD